MRANLEKYIRAKRAIIWCNTSDYKEIDDLLKESIKNVENKEIYEFRALGVIDFNTKEILEEGNNIYQLIDTIFAEGFDTNVFLLIKDSKEQLEKPEIIAYLKKIAEMRYSNPNYNFTTLVIGESNHIPKELEKFVSILEIENMKQDEIEKYILEFGNKNNVKIDEEDIGELTISLKGLTKLEIDHILNMMIENKNTISISDRNIIIKEKGQIIKKSSILELIDFKEKMSDIGGLEGLKEWLESKAKIFRKLDEARAYGVDTPKGVLLVGMPGCGKSLAAKASARLFNAPLLRLDIGRLLGKYVGESEHNMRVALKTAESISPCILWIDEIEKAFAGIDQSGGASDITKRLFGHFLTWLQEKENTVFVVATANDISCFPPEFLRKGRFDEVFFVDFPNEKERERIFEIHLEKRGKKLKGLDIEKIVRKTEGYSGADIEEIIKIAVERAFVYEDGEIETEDIIDIIKEVDSLSVILEEKINFLKEGFKKFKIRSASTPLPLKARSLRKQIKIDKYIPSNKNMVLVKGGKYKPSFYYEERETFDIEVCKYKVSQKEWCDIINRKPSELDYYESLYHTDINPEFPICINSLQRVLEYCNKLSIKCGFQPVYVIDYSKTGDCYFKVKHLNGEIVEPYLADFRKTEGYRLPIELEWEWFARGGEIAIQNGTFDSEYAGKDNYNEVTWNRENSKLNYKDYPQERFHKLGLKKPNELGLYDCVGLTYELCYDTCTSKSIVYLDEGKSIFTKERPYVFKYESNYTNISRGTSIESGEASIFGRRGGHSSRQIGFRVVRTIK